MLASLLIAALALTPPAHDSTLGVVRGEVRSRETGTRLAHAFIELDAGLSRLRTTTDASGRYELRDVPAGWRSLRVAHVSHEPLEVEVWVPAGGELVVDLELEIRPVALPPITARARPGEEPADSLAGAPGPRRGLDGPRVLELTPSAAELGLANGGGSGGGGHEPVDPADVLYVRGAAADLKLVLLDGAPVYSPFPVGGLLEPFEPLAIGSANLYLGGAPARYDGGLSYILDLQTRPGSRTRTASAGEADLLGGRVFVEGPLPGGVAFLGAGRVMHGRGVGPFVEGLFPYAYADGLVRLDASAGAGWLSATGFWNREAVRLESSANTLSTAGWGNSAVSLRYRGPLLGADAELTAAVGRFDARLPLGRAPTFVVDGTSVRSRLAADFSRDVGTALLRYGASYDGQRFSSLTWPTRSTAGEVGPETASGDAVGGYLETVVAPAPTVRVRAGLRGDLFLAESLPRLAPRLAVTWLAGERAALTLAAGRYHQQVRGTVLPAGESGDGGDPADFAPPVPYVTIGRASHLLLGLDQQLGEDVRLGVEGYLKRYEDVPVAGKAGARASGLDVWVSRGSGGLDGWLGYSLAWVWSVEGTGPATSLFFGRQLLSAGLGAPLGEHGRFDVRLSYGSGLPYSAVRLGAAESVLDSGGRPSNLATASATRAYVTEGVGGPPDEPYIRIDAQISRGWHGRRMSFTPYLRVLNALDRRDGIFYLQVGQDEHPRPVAPLPVLPVLGFEWRF